MTVSDIEFEAGRDQMRVERLIKTYLRIDEEKRCRITRLEDHKGMLTAYVDVRDLSLYTAIVDAWEEEGECCFVIKIRDEILCEF